MVKVLILACFFSALTKKDERKPFVFLFEIKGKEDFELRFILIGLEKFSTGHQ